MTDWRGVLEANLVEGIEIATSVSIPDLPEADQERVSDAKALIQEVVAELAEAIGAEDEEARARCLATLGVLREVLRQSDALSDILVAKAIRKTLVEVGELGVRIAMELAAQALAGEIAT